MITKTVEGYVDFWSGLNCVHVVWRFLGVQIWSKDFGLAYRDAIEAAEKFADCVWMGEEL